MSQEKDQMRETLETYAEQFRYQPVIENVEEFTLSSKSRVAICGMGGSNQASELLRRVDPTIDMAVHRDYGLPTMSEERWQDRLVIASSYSGNTEETVDSYDTAIKEDKPTIVIASSGKLLERAKDEGRPYIALPDGGLAPREAIPMSFRAMSRAMGRDDVLAESENLADTLDPKVLEAKGQKLADALQGKIPVVYASRANWIIGYRYKITLNETGKSLAYYNVVPEMNHNETEGPHPEGSTKDLLDKLHYVSLMDSEDHPRVQKRMKIYNQMLRDRGFSVTEIAVEGANVYERIFRTMLIVSWAAYHLSTDLGINSQLVPEVETFKAKLVE